MSARGLRGRRLVLGLYAGLVAVTAVVGYLIGTIVPLEGLDVRLFLLVDLPPTPLGLAAFGAVTVAVGLGVPLALVHLVSRRDPSSRR